MAETQVVYAPFTVTGLFSPLGGVAGPTGATASTAPLSPQVLRARVATAQVNAGATLLPALSYGRYRLIDCIMIAVGGSAATATSVRIAGTQSASTVQLVTQVIANLTQSTPARLDVSTEVLADGASFVACDINTPITINANGTLATATAIDVILTYAIERV